MSPAHRYAQVYRTASVENASPARIVLMLFDGADRFLHQALTGFDRETSSARNEVISNNVLKSQRIVNELRNSLDLANGGELALTLERLYVYVDEQLRLANLKKDPAPIRLTQQLLGEVRSGWAQMMEAPVSAVNA